MKAVVVGEFGGPEKLRVAEVAEPVPGAGQVRVAVKAAGTNPVDASQAARIGAETSFTDAAAAPLATGPAVEVPARLALPRGAAAGAGCLRLTRAGRRYDAAYALCDRDPAVLLRR